MPLADSDFGLNIAQIEERISRGASQHWQAAALGTDQHWIGLPAEVLLTPYDEILDMLRSLETHCNLQAGGLLVDLGAAYGRIGLVIGRLFPKFSFLGYECVAERVDEARRCFELNGFSARVTIELQDLGAADFIPAEADSYFLYDYGSREAIEKTLHDLRAIALKRSIAVVGRGRASRDAIERRHPWLSDVVPPLHCGNYSIYRSSICRLP